VDILLSTDAGITYDTVLASNVANDGSQLITVPNLQAPFCRLKVQPVDNYYYAINPTDFAIDTEVNTDCDTYTDNASASIPDGTAPNTAGTPLIKTTTIDEDVTIESIDVSVEITHTWINDLVIELESPDGTSIKLWDRNCGDEDNMNVTFSASATELPNTCSSPFTGTFKAAEDSISLQDFIGESSLGDWKLIVTDFWDADDGTLESWNLDICYTSILSTQEIENSPDFSITPNPASSNIVIQLLNNTNNDVDVKFYDISGKIVKTSKIQDQESQGVIHISDLSSGIYFVRIDNQEFSTTEKLIIR
jgi:subtilisin-like proprotein convertase family protein